MSHIVLSSWATSSDVQNGEVYETGEIAVGERKFLLVPAQTSLQRGPVGDLIRVFTRKSLFFGGHPSMPMSIVAMAPQMGVAMKGNELIAYGTFRTFEGGSSVDLLLVVPRDVTVKFAPEQEDVGGDFTSPLMDWSSTRFVMLNPDEQRRYSPVSDGCGPVRRSPGTLELSKLSQRLGLEYLASHDIHDQIFLGEHFAFWLPTAGPSEPDWMQELLGNSPEPRVLEFTTRVESLIGIRNGVPGIRLQGFRPVAFDTAVVFSDGGVVVEGAADLMVFDPYHPGGLGALTYSQNGGGRGRELFALDEYGFGRVTLQSLSRGSFTVEIAGQSPAPAVSIFEAHRAVSFPLHAGDGEPIVDSLFVNEGCLSRAPVEVVRVGPSRFEVHVLEALTTLSMTLVDPLFPGISSSASWSHPEHTDPLYRKGHELYLAGQLEESSALYEGAWNRAADGGFKLHPFYAYNVACCQARLGRLEQALLWLERSLGDGFQDFAMLADDGDLVCLRGDSRFEYLARGGITQYAGRPTQRGERLCVDLAGDCGLLALGAVVGGRPWEGRVALLSRESPGARLVTADPRAGELWTVGLQLGPGHTRGRAYLDVRESPVERRCQPGFHVMERIRAGVEGWHDLPEWQQLPSVRELGERGREVPAAEKVTAHAKGLGGQGVGPRPWYSGFLSLRGGRGQAEVLLPEGAKSVAVYALVSCWRRWQEVTYLGSL